MRPDTLQPAVPRLPDERSAHGVPPVPPQGQTALVFGATGTQGGSVVRHLLASGYRVRAGSRHPHPQTTVAPQAVEPTHLDLSVRGSISRAAAGASVAFVHLPITFGAPGDADRARTAIDALVEAGVSRIVFSTSGPSPEVPIGLPYVDDKVAVLQHVLTTGRGTVLKPTGFMENFSAPWSAARVLAGELAYPLAPGAGVAWISNEDVARFVERAFTSPAAIGRSFAVAGPEVLDGPGVAERLSRALGRRVAYRQVTGGEYAEILAPFMGHDTATMIGAFYDQAPPGPNPMMAPDWRTAAAALQVEPMPLERWARAVDWIAATARTPSAGL